MADLDHLLFRLAGPFDAKYVAALHTDSWRRHYRGIYSDAFLDGDVTADRLAVWTARLREPDPRRYTILAEDSGDLVGFAHTVFEDDPNWGALVDNLHVGHGRKRCGIGSRLLTLTAQAVLRRRVRAGLHLWVNEQNTDAQAFYRARGGQCVGRATARRPAECRADCTARRSRYTTLGRIPPCCLPMLNRSARVSPADSLSTHADMLCGYRRCVAFRSLSGLRR